MIMSNILRYVNSDINSGTPLAIISSNDNKIKVENCVGFKI